MLMDASDDVEADREEVETGNTISPPPALSGNINPEINQVLITAPPWVMIGFGLNIFPMRPSRSS